MQVPLLDLKGQYAAIRAEVDAAIREVAESQQFILGPVVEAFEKEIAAYLEVPHAIACASGSDALLLALLAYDVGPGDAVLCPPFTFFATGGAIARLGAEPRFIDIEPEGYNLDAAALERYFEANTEPDPLTGKRVDKRSGNHVAAIMPVHLYGQPADMAPILAVAERVGVPVIEDAAQAIGARYGGKRVGALGAVGCFSFFPSKNLGAWGDAGLLTTHDAALAEKLQMLRVHGSAKRYYHTYVGVNSRLDAIQAAVLRVKLRHLDDWTAARQGKAQRYDRLLAQAGLVGRVTPPRVLADREDIPQSPGRAHLSYRGASHIFHQYVVRVPGRDAVREALKANGIGTEVYYPVPLHLQECFQDLGWRKGAFPVSERAAAEVLALPIYPELTEEQQRYVVSSLAAALG